MCWLTKIMRDSGETERIPGATSIPLMSGRPISSRTISGRSSSTFLSASLPSVASPTTSRFGFDLRTSEARASQPRDHRLVRSGSNTSSFPDTARGIRSCHYIRRTEVFHRVITADNGRMVHQLHSRAKRESHCTAQKCSVKSGASHAKLLSHECCRGNSGTLGFDAAASENVTRNLWSAAAGAGLSGRPACVLA